MNEPQAPRSTQDASAGERRHRRAVAADMEEMLAGEMEGARLDDALGFQMAILVSVPLGMAAVTLLASDRVNRYANLIAGLLIGLALLSGRSASSSAAGSTGTS